MNIGFVIPSMLRGGAERVISILCNEYAKKGNRVSLYLTEISDEISFPLHENVKIVDCTVGGKSFWSKVPGYIRILKKRFKADQLDLVVSFITRTNILSVLACNKVGIPVIISERNNPYLVPANPYFRKFRDLIYKRADGLVFQTTYARDYYGSNLSAKSAVIMNPVDIQHDVLNYKDKENVIVTACRLEKQKNVKMLIDAFSLISDKIPHYRLDIYGDGSLREELQSQIDNLKLNNKVKLLGVDKNVISKVAKAKIFALTSDFEGLSNSLAEALCVGAACVVTDSPTFGNRDLIENNQSGFITPVADADAFSAKLLELALDGDLGEKFSINAKNISGKINITSIIEQWDKYIDKVTHQSATETMATKSGGGKILS